jgi:hypothetical protein
MRIEAVEEAKVAARRFLTLADMLTYRTGGDANWVDSSPKLTGALRRASMDLTRALAEMRKL